MKTQVLNVQLFLLRTFKNQVERATSDPMVACYIDSSYPALLFFAYKYADSPERAVLANANAGEFCRIDVWLS